MFYPKVRLKGVEAPEAKLLWHKIMRGDQDGGEILVEAELFLVRNYLGLLLMKDIVYNLCSVVDTCSVLCVLYCTTYGAYATIP